MEEEKKDDVNLQLQQKRRSVNNDLLRKFKKKPAIKNKRLRKSGKKLTRKLYQRHPSVNLYDFVQTPEAVVEIMAIFCKCFVLALPEEILRLVVAFSTPTLLRVNPHQTVSFKNCHGINVKLQGKGQQVLITNCTNFTLQVEDLIRAINVFDSEGLDISTVGGDGVPAYMMTNSGDVKVRFRDDSGQTAFSTGVSKGLIQVASFSRGEDLVEFDQLQRIVRLSDDNSSYRWSQTNGWQILSPVTGEWLEPCFYSDDLIKGV